MRSASRASARRSRRSSSACTCARLEFFLALFILYTVLGCLIESLGMIVITVPLIFPVLPSYGIDPLLFGVVLVLFVELGQISPPIGINLFVIQSIWDGKLSEVILGTIPFHSDDVRGACVGDPRGPISRFGCPIICRDDRSRTDAAQHFEDI